MGDIVCGIMALVPFVALFILVWNNSGFKEACIPFLVVGALVAWYAIAISMIGWLE